MNKTVRNEAWKILYDIKIYRKDSSTGTVDYTYTSRMEMNAVDCAGKSEMRSSHVLVHNIDK